MPWAIGAGVLAHDSPWCKESLIGICRIRRRGGPPSGPLEFWKSVSDSHPPRALEFFQNDAILVLMQCWIFLMSIIVKKNYGFVRREKNEIQHRIYLRLEYLKIIKKNWKILSKVNKRRFIIFFFVVGYRIFFNTFCTILFLLLLILRVNYSCNIIYILFNIQYFYC